jgi:hypothetical protein
VTLARLADALELMQRHKGQNFGKVAVIDDGGISGGGSCEQVVLDRALDDLAEAASRDERIAGARGGLDNMVRELAAAVSPRSDYGLIHGELGPDHVMVAGTGTRSSSTSRVLCSSTSNGSTRSCASASASATGG